jgi:hypothetical protein
MKTMKTTHRTLLALLASAALALPAWASPTTPTTPAAPHGHTHGQQHTPAQIQQDIQRHQAMAAAHQAAAECLQAGRGERVCHQALRAACTGIALGNYCGMRHVH